MTWITSLVIVQSMRNFLHFYSSQFLSLCFLMICFATLKMGKQMLSVWRQCWSLFNKLCKRSQLSWQQGRCCKLVVGCSHDPPRSPSHLSCTSQFKCVTTWIERVRWQVDSYLSWTGYVEWQTCFHIITIRFLLHTCTLFMVHRSFIFE